MISTPVPGKTVTTRKCANCGQAGHIRGFLQGLRGESMADCFRYQQKALSKTERAVGGIRNESTCSGGDSYWLLISFYGWWDLVSWREGVMGLFYLLFFCKAWSHALIGFFALICRVAFELIARDCLFS